MKNTLNIGTGERFFSFTNADGKTWLIPVRNCRTALNLYQPSGWKGKLLKKHLYLLRWSRALRSTMHVKTIRCEFAEGFKTLLCSLFKVSDIEFSVFLGTPSVHQKTTIQLSVGKKILGYCKVTDKEEIAELFDGEAQTLKKLNEKGVEGIPRCIYSGTWKKGIYIFVQSTEKTNQSTVPHQWSQLQGNFLKKLHEKTKRSLLFEETDFYETLIQLRQHTEWLPDAESRKTVETAIETVLESNRCKTVEYSAYHADFTPWNMFVENGRLFVFDWEYAKLTYPPLLDRCHFLMQTAIFERHKTVDDIIELLNSNGWMANESLQYYLLDIVGRYVMREQGKYYGDVAKSMAIWLEILLRINNIK